MDSFWTYDVWDIQHGYYYTRFRWENMMNSDIKIFVYGTLKKNFCNHRYLSGSRFLGSGKTVEKYAMYTDGRIPFVVQNHSVSYIFGELYSVDQGALSNLDRLEGHPTWYERQEVDVYLDGSMTNPAIKAWMYFYPHPVGTLIPKGIFENQF